MRRSFPLIRRLRRCFFAIPNQGSGIPAGQFEDFPGMPENSGIINRSTEDPAHNPRLQSRNRFRNPFFRKISKKHNSHLQFREKNGIIILIEVDSIILC